jgi:hypothetical protein
VSQALQEKPAGSPPVAQDITAAQFAVLEQVILGRTLAEAGAPPDFLSQCMANPLLMQAMEFARKYSSYAMEEEALALLRALAKAPGTAQAVRAADLLATQLRWSAVKRNPSVYSEKAAVNVTVPIQINTTLDMGDAIAAATKDYPNIYELKAETVQTYDREQLPPEVIDDLERAGGEALREAERGAEGKAQEGPPPLRVAGLADARGARRGAVAVAPRVAAKKPRKVQRNTERADAKAEGVL